MTVDAKIEKSAGTLYQLRLNGNFTHPHWTAFLFANLARLGVSVVSGRALQDSSFKWNAEFLFNFELAKVLPDQIDFVALSESQPELSLLDPPRLHRFEINRKQHSIEVVLVAPDQIGFLGRILTRLSLLALFPVEMQIDTNEGLINDRIVFRTISGKAVDENVNERLLKLLQSLVKSSA